MKYFENCNTLEELRKEYKKALKKYHPDNGGDMEKCKEINLEYEQIFERLKNKNFTETENKKAESKKWDAESDAKIRDMLFKFVRFENINIEVVGCWIWIDGDTYKIKNHLKENGFKWSKNRKKWHWTSEPETEYRYYKKKMKFDEIRNKYGSYEIQTEKIKQLN